MKIYKALKYLTGALAIFTLGITLAACGSKGSSSNASSSGVTHITYWHVNAQTMGGQSVEKLVKEFNSTHKNIKVTAKFNPNMYQGLMQNLQSAQASGNVPDIVQVGWAYTNYFSNTFKYLSPTDAQKKFDSSSNFINNNFTTNTLSFAKNSKDKLVGLPYSLSTPILYVNKDLLKKYGIDASSLSTWEGVRAAADKIKTKSSGNTYGLYIQEPGDTWAQQAMMLSNGAKIQENGKATFASSQGVKAYQFYQDMVNKDKSAIHTQWDQGIDDFITGKVAMMFTTVAQASHIKSGANFNVGSQEAPTFKGNKLTVPVGGSMLAITSQDSAKQKAAWTFEKFLYKNSSLATWTKATGYLPPTKDAANSKEFKAYFTKMPLLKPALQEVGSAVPWTSFPKNGLQAEQTMIDARSKILSGGDVSSTLKDAQNTINSQQ